MVVFLVLLFLTISPIPTNAQTQQYVGSAPTLKGLVAWYVARPGFTGGPKWYDVVGRFHATLTNTGTAGTTSGWVAGSRQGGTEALAFDGSNDYAVTVSSALLFPVESTVTLWVKRTATGINNQLLVGGDTGGDRQLYVQMSGKLAYQINFTTGNFGGEFTTPQTLAIGTWYHVALGISPDRGFRLLVDCQLGQAFTPDGSQYAALTTALAFGAEQSGTAGFFTGQLDDIRIYKRHLVDSEVCAIMQESRLGSPNEFALKGNNSQQPFGFIVAANLGRFFKAFQKR